jgi:hypothetical protein
MTKVWLTRDADGLFLWDEEANPFMDGLYEGYNTASLRPCIIQVDRFFGHNFGLKMNERGLFNIRLDRVPIPKDKKNTKGDE